MSWVEGLWWLPVAAVAVMTALAVLAAATRPAGSARTRWLAGLVVAGIVALAVSAWQQHAMREAIGGTAARLSTMRQRLDDIGGLLPGGPGASPGETFDTVATAIRSLNGRIGELEGQIRTLREKTRHRGIDPDTAAKMTDFLRRAGSQRVVVSCAPDDMEAFAYANQIANVLREAGWEALGPEKTTIFGEGPAMAVRLFVRSGVVTPEAVRILIDAFTRFNIPYQSGVAASDAIPDPLTTEVYVSHKP